MAGMQLPKYLGETKPETGAVEQTPNDTSADA